MKFTINKGDKIFTECHVKNKLKSYMKEMNATFVKDYNEANVFILPSRERIRKDRKENPYVYKNSRGVLTTNSQYVYNKHKNFGYDFLEKLEKSTIYTEGDVHFHYTIKEVEAREPNPGDSLLNAYMNINYEHGLREILEKTNNFNVICLLYIKYNNRDTSISKELRNDICNYFGATRIVFKSPSEAYLSLVNEHGFRIDYRDVYCDMDLTKEEYYISLDNIRKEIELVIAVEKEIGPINFDFKTQSPFRECDVFHTGRKYKDCIDIVCNQEEYVFNRRSKRDYRRTEDISKNLHQDVANYFESVASSYDSSHLALLQSQAYLSYILQCPSMSKYIVNEDTDN